MSKISVQTYDKLMIDAVKTIYKQHKLIKQLIKCQQMEHKACTILAMNCEYIPKSDYRVKDILRYWESVTGEQIVE